MKKTIVMLLVLFICGVLSADVCIEVLRQSGDFAQNPDIYTGYANANLVFKDVFWNIVYERMKLCMILLLLGITPFKEKLSILLFAVFSFCWGFFVMSSITELGLAGVVVGISAVVPHGLCYMLMLVLLFGKKRRYSYHAKESVLIHFGTYVLIFLFFVTGCVIETLVSTYFIPWVIRLSLI